MSWTDEPIRDAAQDTLGRREFADRLVDLIERTHDPSSSIVIGLTGAWGSGKTSVFQLARAQLNHDSWTIVELNPWVAADEDAMMAEFFSALSQGLPSKSGPNLKRALAVCASLAAPGLSAIPAVGEAASGYAEKLAQHLNGRKPWPTVFKETSDAFLALGRRIVVFVDDCDRLDPSELRTLLKVVRLIGRFPGITYLLAYDEETIAKTLSAAGVGDKSTLGAQRYLEKIVQFIAPVPPLTASEVLGRLVGSLEPLLRVNGWDPEILSEYRLNRAFEEVVLRRLSTPRSIDRYAAQAENLLSHLDPGEFDAIDLLILLFARLHFPEAYARLPDWQSRLLGPGVVKDPRGRGEGTPIDWDPLLKFAGDRPEDRQDLLRTLGCVFPAFQQHLDIDDGSMRVGTQLYFERHILLGVPRGEVRDKDVTEALNMARQDPSDFSHLDRMLSPDQTNYAIALQKVRRQTEAWAVGEVALGFILHIAALRESVPKSIEFGHHGSSLLLWAASLLPLVRRHASGAAVVSALREAFGDERAAYIAKRVVSPTDDDPWMRDVTDEMTKACLSASIAQLRLGDTAPPDSHIHSFVGFLGRVERIDQLVPIVKDALEDEEFSLDDVAARCVSIIQSYGDGSRHLDSVDAQLLAYLTGTSELSPPSTTAWPDRNDLSWPNRREWARWALGPGRVSGLPDL